MSEARQGISKNQVKLIKSLAIKKYRIKHKLFIAEGKKLIEELSESNYRVKSCWVLDDVESTSLRFPCSAISRAELKNISQLTQPHYGLALVQMPDEIDTAEQKINLVLDGISDPGNMGTIIRLADWYGLNKIVCVNNCVDVFNSKTVQASMGSLFRIQVVEKEPDNIKWISPVYGAYLDGDNLHTAALKTPCTLIVGSESQGINPNLTEFCHARVSIPRFGRAESLNAGVATGIILNHLVQVGKS